MPAKSNHFGPPVAEATSTRFEGDVLHRRLFTNPAHSNTDALQPSESESPLIAL